MLVSPGNNIFSKTKITKWIYTGLSSASFYSKLLERPVITIKIFFHNIIHKRFENRYNGLLKYSGWKLGSFSLGFSTFVLLAPYTMSRYY